MFHAETPMLALWRGTRQLFIDDNAELCALRYYFMQSSYIYGKQRTGFLQEFSFQLDIEDECQIAKVETVSENARLLLKPMSRLSQYGMEVSTT